MRKQMLFVNLILLIVAASLGWKLRADWMMAARRQAALAATSSTATLPVAGPAAAPAPAGGWEVMVAGNLFFSDRNNEMPRVAEKRPMPPDPILIGTMNLGRTKLALLLEANQTGRMPRQVKEGEDFGGYKVAEIGDNQITVDWEGTKKKVDVTSAPRAESQPPAYAPTASAPSAPTVGNTNSAPVSNTSQVSQGGKTGPSDEIMPGTTSRRAYPGDNSPAGTVVNGFIKVERVSPFGKETWWQKVEGTPTPQNERKPK